MYIRTFGVKRWIGADYMDKKILFSFLVLIILSLGCYVLNMFYINIPLSLAIFFVTLFLYSDYRLRREHNISERKTMSREDIIKNAQTGDYLFFETSHTMGNIYHILPVLSIGCSHIGIIVRRNGIPYLLESSHNKEYCPFSRREKTGVKCLPLEERLMYVTRNYHYVQNNLHTYLDKKEVEIDAFIERYKHRDYMDNLLNCCNLILVFLQELQLLKHPYSLYIPFCIDYTNLLDPSFYRIPFSCTCFKRT
jgi:hypothetical protein